MQLAFVAAGGFGFGKFQIDFSITVLHADAATPKPGAKKGGLDIDNLFQRAKDIKKDVKKDDKKG